MAKRPKPGPKSSSERVERWGERLADANKVYDDWESRYKCKRLFDYYLGKQWAGLAEDEAAKRYVVNLFASTIDTKLPSLLFYRPRVLVEPKPAHSDDANSQAADRAQLQQNVVQTYVDKKEVAFVLNTTLSLLDAEFRFGVSEVGYSADWVDNPHAGKPMLKDDETELLDSEGRSVLQPEKVPQNENLYVRRIPARQCRVGTNGKNVLNENDWFGYYEWVPLEDVKGNPAYSNTANLKPSGEMNDSGKPSTDPDHGEKRKMVKIWKIWSLREKKRYVLADGHKDFLIDGKPYSFLPFAVLKYREILDEFYPKPPTFDWIDPQNEVNDRREADKIHFKRFYRRYQIGTGRIDEIELDKLATGGDGVYVKVNGQLSDPAILPVPDAPIDVQHWAHEDRTKQDFVEISGVSGEERGVADAETATQANIVDVRSRIRESYGRYKVAEWLGDICRLMLLTLRENMQLPFAVKINADPYAQDANEVQRTADTWQQVTSAELGDIDFDVSVDVSSLSPVTEDAQKMAWNQVLGLLTNPSLLMVLMSSDALLRKTLAYYGIKSDKEIKEIQKAGAQVLAMLQAQQMAQPQPKGALGPGAPAPGQIPPQAQLANQVQDQLARLQ